MSEITVDPNSAGGAADDLEECLKAVVEGPFYAGSLSVADALPRLDALARAEHLDERLRHYLQRRSYVKALEHVRAAQH
ncbi:MAG: hypothetical protein JJU00_17805 [Opitutales bacterium]|nr:hypothetical protein [Opitutales bacterium]